MGTGEIDEIIGPLPVAERVHLGKELDGSPVQIKVSEHIVGQLTFRVTTDRTAPLAVGDQLCSTPEQKTGRRSTRHLGIEGLVKRRVEPQSPAC